MERIVITEGLSGVEVVIAQTVSGFLGEIEPVSSNRENGKKAYHIVVVLTLRDTSSFQYFGFPPSGTSFFIPAASFTEGFVNPAVDPARLVVPVLIVLVLILILVVIAVVVLVVIVGEQPSEICEGIVVVVTLPLDSFG